MSFVNSSIFCNVPSENLSAAISAYIAITSSINKRSGLILVSISYLKEVRITPLHINLYFNSQ